MATKNKRNLAYERKFRTYLFNRDVESHKKVVKHISGKEYAKFRISKKRRKR